MGDFSLDLKAILTIIGILTAVIIAYAANWWRNRKSLSYLIIGDTPLLTSSEEIRKEIQILYKGQPVKDVRLLILKIINDGHQPIDEKDFKKSVDFIFADDAHILSVETISVIPDNLLVETSFNENVLSLDPILLNSKDSIELKVIVSSYEEKIKCDGRILGVKEIRHRSQDNFTTALVLMYSGMFLTMGGALFLADPLKFAPFSGRSVRDLFFNVLFYFGLFIFAIGFFVGRRLLMKLSTFVLQRIKRSIFRK